MIDGQADILVTVDVSDNAAPITFDEISLVIDDGEDSNQGNGLQTTAIVIKKVDCPKNKNKRELFLQRSDSVFNPNPIIIDKPYESEPCTPKENFDADDLLRALLRHLMANYGTLFDYGGPVPQLNEISSMFVDFDPGNTTGPLSPTLTGPVTVNITTRFSPLGSAIESVKGIFGPDNDIVDYIVDSVEGFISVEERLQVTVSGADIDYEPAGDQKVSFAFIPVPGKHFSSGRITFSFQNLGTDSNPNIQFGISAQGTVVPRYRPWFSSAGTGIGDLVEDKQWEDLINDLTKGDGGIDGICEEE